MMPIPSFLAIVAAFSLYYAVIGETGISATARLAKIERERYQELDLATR